MLILAIELQGVEIVQALLEAGADPNRPDFRDTTPIVAAVTQKPKAAEMLRLLLEHGADPNLPCGQDKTVAIEIALMGGTLDVPLLLLSVTDEEWLSDQLILNSRRGDFGPLFFAVADMSRRHELPIGESKLEEFPPLSRAILNRDLVQIEQLLRSHPEDIDERDRYGFSALMWASSRFGTVELAQVLLEAGADPKATGDGQWTALHAAVESNDAKMVRLLCEAGADPNTSVRYQRPRPPLVCSAALHCGASAFKALLDAGADPFIRSSDGRNQVIACAEYNRTEERDSVLTIAKQAIEQTKPGTPLNLHDESRK